MEKLEIIDCGAATEKTQGHPFPTLMVENGTPPFTYCLPNHSCFPFHDGELPDPLAALKTQYELEESLHGKS